MSKNEISFRSNKVKTKVKTQYIDRPNTATEDEIIEYCAEKDSVFICISGAHYGATGGSQRPQQIAEGLAKQGYGVIHLSYKNGNNLFKYNDYNIGVLNLKSLDIIVNYINKISNKIIYTSFPDNFSYKIYKLLNNDWFKIYDCVDEWSNFESAKSWFNQKYEDEIANRSNLVLGTANILCQKFDYHNNVLHLSNSTKVDVSGKDWSASQPIDLTFVGFLNEEWIDFNIFRLLAKNYKIRIIGDPPNDLRKFEHKNVEWTGKKDSSEIVKLMSEAKVGIIPFKNMPLVWAVDAIKKYDYLASGIPTVSSYMPETTNIKYGYNVNSTQEFFDKIKWCLDQNFDRQEILAEAQNHTIDKRIEELLKHLPEVDNE